MLKVQRVYEKKEADDGKRILIDRLWPRGLRKNIAQIDEWCKELAPSTNLREWYKHDITKWEEFRKKYLEELATPEKRKVLENIIETAKYNNVTLLYSSKDADHSNAKVLEEVINNCYSARIKRHRIMFGG